MTAFPFAVSQDAVRVFPHQWEDWLRDETTERAALLSIPNRCLRCGSVLPLEGDFKECSVCLMRLGLEREVTSGTRLGPYEILAPLGAGGMGEVYRARDTNAPDREVAIKVLPQSCRRDPDALARFEREAKAVAALSHPNILADPRLRDSTRATAYAVMELLEGETLRGQLDAGPIPRAMPSSTRSRSRRASPPLTRRASSTGT